MNNRNYKKVNLPGWCSIDDDPVRAQAIEKEFYREITDGHLLKNAKIKLIAFRDGIDDILFQHINENDRFTMVHISWIGKKEINDRHPTVEFDGSFEQLLKYENYA